MKRIKSMLVILTILIGCSGLSEAFRTDDALVFHEAVNMLRQINSRESIEDARQLFQGIASNYSQSNLFAIYASVLLDIYDGYFDGAITKIEVLSMQKDFPELLQSNGLQSCDVLQNYIQGRRFEDAGDYQAAIGIYATMNFFDSPQRMIDIMGKDKEQRYAEAMALFESGKYAKAAKAFSALGNYKDSKKMAKKAAALVPTPKPTPKPTPTSEPQDYSEGGIVTFGHYDQDNNRSNGAEPIEWIVLKNDGDTIMLISKYGLDMKLYNTKDEEVTWETCTLRKWLNGEFLNTAFSAEEQTRLQTVKVKAEDNPEYGTDAGNNTQDKVFLLSIDEANRYFRSDADRVCMSTQTAESNGPYTNDNSGACWWWLRSPGNNTNRAAYVIYDGFVRSRGSLVSPGRGGVRPVVVLRLS